ncbi:MAG TPA: VWA domain-containing protein, partial [Deltaproteobacteria bacterium]|nr:VWA domain-containing protein [Deltaproteobacteria bacterium]
VVGAPPPRWDEAVAARLVDHHGRLATLASMMAGCSITLEASRGAGGIRGTTLLLPEAIDRGPDAEVNRALYVVRVCLDATMVRLRPRRVGADATRATAAAARALLEDELPRFAAISQELSEWIDPPDPETGACLLWGRLLEIPQLDEVHAAASAPSDVQTEIATLGVEDVTLEPLRPEDERELPLHSFEKVELLERFNGNLRQLDGDDDLQAHLEALDEVDLGHLVRGGPDTAAVLSAEIGIEARIPDVSKAVGDEPHVAYPEWDCHSGRYRPRWCAVYPTSMGAPVRTGASEAALRRRRHLVERLHHALLTHRSERRTVTRQIDGTIDIDAVVDALGELRAGRQPSDQLYMRRRQITRDVATTVLLDISLSSDAWIAGTRVLDIARDAVLVLGEVAERLHDPLQVLAFASHTRNRIRVFVVRDWDEPWTRAKARLDHLTPQGYTRLGPAVRHAAALLDRHRARRKLLLVITDGKPTDFDRYEGRYGTRDVKRALDEATDLGIAVHALAIDEVARHALPTMLGPGRWTVLSNPERLPEALGHVYDRLTA